MAVATDSHRDFLIPEQADVLGARQRMERFHSDTLRLFFCASIIQQIGSFVKTDFYFSGSKILIPQAPNSRYKIKTVIFGGAQIRWRWRELKGSAVYRTFNAMIATRPMYYGLFFSASK